MKEQMSIAQLQNTCIDLKKHVIDMIYKAQSGHPGGSLSVAEFVTACYFREMNVDPENPKWEDRDRFVMSKGHVCPAQYAALAMRGFFPMEVLDTLRKEGSMLQGHPDMKKCPGIDISTGSLGQGLSVAAGLAAGLRLTGEDGLVFTVLGDGECEEGQVWEAAMSAPHFKLGNLIGIVDRNRYMIDGETEDVMPLEPFADKWRAFGWEVVEVDGHDFDALERAFAAGRPRTCPCSSSPTPSRARAWTSWKTTSSTTMRPPIRSCAPAPRLRS